jgi:hypothetical protein
LAGAKHKKTLWKTTDNLPLNQGTDGGSVGFGWAAMLEQVNAEEFPASARTATNIQHMAHMDDVERSNILIGASLLGAARYLKRSRYITGYRWGLDTNEIIDCLSVFGPILLGLQWFDSMYNPRPNGIVEVNGPSVGEHCVLADGYLPAEDAMRMGLGPTELIRFVNSFGTGYGIAGRGYLRVMDLAFLLKPENRGEGVVPLNMQATEQLEGWAAFTSRPLVRRLNSPFRRD